MFLGVDAGNSKTVALVCDGSGQVRGAARTGNGDIYGASSADAAVDAVVSAVESALGSAGVGAAGVTGAAFRLAGVDWPEDLAYWRHTLATRLPGLTAVSILNDGFAPLRCGDLGGVGVAVVVGTGPAIAARGPQGHEVSLGWWLQAPLGATGLGDRALQSVYDAHLGLGPPTALTAALLGAYGENSVPGLLQSFTRREGPRGWLDRALSARPVLTAAGAGDPVATAIVIDQADRLGAYAGAAAGQAGFALDGSPVTVVLSGSVLAGPGSPLDSGLRRSITESIPGAVVIRPRLPPVTGAVLDAIAEAGGALDAQVVQTLAASAPDPAFLRT